MILRKLRRRPRDEPRPASSAVMTASRLRPAWPCRALACGVAAAVLAASPARAQSFERIADWIRTELETDAAPSLAVAVARDGRILWAEGFGHADRERRIPATADTPYSLASVSKPITATGLMMLVDRGLVRLDDPVNAYLGEAKLRVHVGSADAVTVRSVAMHTAGLPLHHHFFEAGRRSPPPMEETIQRYGHVVATPGARFQYSNLGYGVLGHLIGLLTGRSYARFMREELFLPLGMARTSVGLPPDVRGDHAIRYARDGSPLPYYEFDHDGASAVFSTARDLARFGLFHLGRPLKEPSPVEGASEHRGSARSVVGPLLSAARIREMQRAGTDRAGDTGYGIGWQIRDTPRGRIVKHGGGMPGVTTSLTLVPSARLVIVALANASTTLPARVTERVLSAFVPSRAEPASAGTWVRQDPLRRGRRPGRGLAGAWSGTVEAGSRQIPLHVRIETSGAVVARLDEGPETLLAAVTFGRDELRGFLRRTRLPSEDASRTDVLLVSLTRRGDALGGSLTAVASSDDALGFALSHWVDLRRDGAAAVALGGPR